MEDTVGRIDRDLRAERRWNLHAMYVSMATVWGGAGHGFEEMENATYSAAELWEHEQAVEAEAKALLEKDRARRVARMQEAEGAVFSG